MRSRPGGCPEVLKRGQLRSPRDKRLVAVPMLRESESFRRVFIRAAP